jgi:hypothetical protein
MAKKKVEKKDARTNNKKSESSKQKESDPFKIYFDIALLKAKEINKKYDINEQENSNLLIPK